MEVTLQFEVSDSSRVGEARRAGAKVAHDLAFSAADAERLALVVTELGTNLVKHARRGELLIMSGRRFDPPRIDVLAIDRGPGTDDAGTWLRDGYSTSGSPGTGLGAVRRLSDKMDVHSVHGVGTGVLARVQRRDSGAAASAAAAAMGAMPAGPGFEAAGIAVPIHGEQVCGDGWAACLGDARAALTLADGLGHGPDAAMASAEAIRVFHENDALAPAEVLTRMAAELGHTRGAAVAVAALEPRRATVRFAGIGNVAGVVVDGLTQKNLVSYNGTVGHTSARIREMSYEFPPGAVIVLHSDGLKSHWKLDAYPGLQRRDPALIAGILYRDFARGTDDVGILVARELAGGAAHAAREERS